MPTVGICDWFADQYPKWEWIERGFKSAHCKTVRIRTAYSLKQKQDQCDFILFSHRPPIDWMDMLNITKSVPWYIWVFDYLGEPFDLIKQVPWNLFDVVFNKTPKAINHRNSLYLDQAAPPWERFPDDHERPYKVLFPGIWTEAREALVNRVIDAGHDVTVAGKNWCYGEKYTYIGEHVRDAECRDLFGSALICFGAPLLPHMTVPGYYSDRRYMAYAAGAVYTEQVPAYPIDMEYIMRRRRWQYGVIPTYTDRAEEIITIWRSLQGSHGSVPVLAVKSS